MNDAPSFGWFDPNDAGGDFNVQAFVVRQLLSSVHTASIVQIQAVKDINGNPVSTPGNLAPVGLVDMLIIVNMIDSQGNPTVHSAISNVPYLRIQGGLNAIICDPQVGDIGIALFAERDISSVKKTQQLSNPGSWRRFDYADGLYLGGILNKTPNQYVQFTPTGINVVDKNKNTIAMSPSGITITDDNQNTITMAAGGITINQVLFDNSSAFNINTHSHSQGADNHGDTEQNVSAPISGS